MITGQDVALVLKQGRYLLHTVADVMCFQHHLREHHNDSLHAHAVTCIQITYKLRTMGFCSCTHSLLRCMEERDTHTARCCLQTFNEVAEWQSLRVGVYVSGLSKLQHSGITDLELAAARRTQAMNLSRGMQVHKCR